MVVVMLVVTVVPALLFLFFALLLVSLLVSLLVPHLARRRTTTCEVRRFGAVIGPAARRAPVPAPVDVVVGAPSYTTTGYVSICGGASSYT
jgi:hypothetical protein